jgi:hypothetical protein
MSYIAVYKNYTLKKKTGYYLQLIFILKIKLLISIINHKVKISLINKDIIEENINKIKLK